MYDLVVIGAGPAGYDAAAHAARTGKKVALIEKNKIGGTCLNVGCIPAKTFLRSSKLYHECRHAAAYGVRLAGPVELDMPAVVARKNKIVATLTRGVEGMLKRAGVETIAGTARITGRGTVAVGDRALETANILIATGSRVAVPPIPGIRAEKVLDSDTVFNLDHVPARIAIIGGGIIGLEFACFFNEVGAKVEVFEMLPHIAAGCDGEISSRMLQILTRQGVEFHLSCRVDSIEGQTLHYGESTATADWILNATGRSPNVQDLGLESIGADFSPKGIRTSEYGKTNVAGVWACGDVTGRRMLAHAATREAIVAVNNMFGAKQRIRYGAIPSVIYTHPEVASAGATEEELKQAAIPYIKSAVPMAVAGRFLVEHEGATGMLKVLAGERYHEILGVHAIGDASSEFIVAAAAMIEAEMTAAEAAEIVFPHPTVSEALREAVLGLPH